MISLAPLIRDGKVGAIAFARGERWPEMPDLPTLVESGYPDFTIDGLVTLYPLIKAGKVRALAIARGERWPALPDVPTLVESGYPDFVIDAWTGLVAPAGTPRAIVDQLNAAVNDGLKSEAAQDSLAKFSAIAKIGTPEDFKAFLAEQTQKWGAIVKLAGAKLD
jgi:tripartite-type tricarboxylate transporter receptor subunit TctC